MPKAVAFTGSSNSGKTTLIIKIARLLIPDKRVAIVKNDPKDKARFDLAGKDSDRFFQIGAEVAVISPARTTLFTRRQSSIDDAIRLFGEFDYLFVEGLKYLPLPRIAVFRGAVDAGYFPYIKAAAVDGSIDRSQIPGALDIIDLNDERSALAWIDKNAKEV